MDAPLAGAGTMDPGHQPSTGAGTPVAWSQCAKTEHAQRSSTTGIPNLSAHRPYDEMRDASGGIRPHYRAHDDWLKNKPPDFLKQKQREGGFYLGADVLNNTQGNSTTLVEFKWQNAYEPIQITRDEERQNSGDEHKILALAATKTKLVRC